MTMTVPHDSPLDLTDEDFRELVDEALRANNDDYAGRLTSEDLEKLRSPEVIGRTYNVLTSMKKNVEGQLAARRSDHAVKLSRAFGNAAAQRELVEDYQRWRSGALRFKTGVEEFMLSIRPDLDGDYFTAYQELCNAVKIHREEVTRAVREDRDTGPYDQALWSKVEPRG